MTVINDDVPVGQVFDAFPDGMVVCVHWVMNVLVKEDAVRMYGYGRDELVGKRIEILIPDRLRARHEGHLDAFTGSPRLRPMGSGLDLHGRRKDGGEFPVEISLSPIKI